MLITVTLWSKEFSPKHPSQSPTTQGAMDGFTQILMKLIHTNIDENATVAVNWEDNEVAKVNAVTCSEPNSDEIVAQVHELIQAVWHHQTGLSFTFWELGNIYDLDSLMQDMHDNYFRNGCQFRKLVKNIQSAKIYGLYEQLKETFDELSKLTEDPYNTAIDG